jgi:hypothetical protein
MSRKKARDGTKAAAGGKGGTAQPRATTKAQSLSCATCGKTMKNANTLKLHERNCRAPQGSPTETRSKPDPTLIALMDIKDSMDSERRELLRYVAEREAAMQGQLAETRTALLAEVGRTAVPRVTPSSGIEVGTYQASGQVPRAESQRIVMEPQPMQQFAPPTATVTETHFVAKEQVDRLVHESLASIPRGLSADEVTEIARREVANSLESLAPTAGATPEDLDKLAGTLGSKLSEIQARFGELDLKLASLAADRVEASRMARIAKDIERLDWKVEQLMDEVGFGESLDVSKIPPNILEIVYQATLDDVVKEMGKTRSLQEVGTMIERTLEEVRKNTSGSELFRYNGRRVVTENLARSIDQGLISAKQIQTTYAELLMRLLESVPGYKPKNFRAMIKIKSQEYAVDRVTHLLGRIENAEKVLDNTGQMIAAFTAQSQARFNQLGSRVDEVAGPMMERKVEAGPFEELRLAVNEIRLAVTEVARENSRLIARLEMGLPPQAEQIPAEAPQEGVPAAEAQPLTDGEKLVLNLLAEGPSSVSLLRRKAEAFLSAEDCKAAIEGLQAKGWVVSEKLKKGRRLSAVAKPEPIPAPVTEPHPPMPSEAAAEAASAPQEIVYAPEAVLAKPEEGEVKPSEEEGGTEAPPAEGETVRGAGEAAEGGEGHAEVLTQETTPEGGPSEGKAGGLTPLQERVLESIGDGATMPTLRKGLDGVKYTEILMSVRILIDAGLVTAETHGRGTTYKRVKVKRAKSEEVNKDA